MRKDGYIVWGFFVILSLVFFLLGMFSLNRTTIFLDDAIETQAIILKHTQNNKNEARLIIRFNDQQGQPHIYDSSVSSQYFSEDFNRGQTTIFYNPENPKEVRFDKFTSLWGGALAGFLFAFGFGFFPIVIAIFMYSLHRRRVKLIKQGRKIQAKIQSIEQRKNNNKINNDSPWIITCRWKDEKSESHNEYEFISNEIQFNPRPFIRDSTLDVYFYPENPNHYYIDIRFLPNEKKIKSMLKTENKPIITNKGSYLGWLAFFSPTLILLIIILFISYSNHTFYQRAKIITGTVVNHVEKDYQYYPVVSYYDLNNQPNLFVEKIHPEPFLEKGTSVELLIDPDNQLDVSLKSNQLDRWIWVIILGIMAGFCFIIFFIPILIVSIFQKKDDN